MSDDHLLVTGGAGFIGSHLVDALLERGDRVTVLDRLSAGGSTTNLRQHLGDPRLTFVEGDVRDAVVVERLVAASTPWCTPPPRPMSTAASRSRREFLDTNVLGTRSVLDACRSDGTRHADALDRRGVRRRRSQGWLVRRGRATASAQPVRGSKAAGDLLCAAYVSTYGTPVVVVRGTNAFGPRQIERVVPTFAVNALRGLPVPVYGRGEQRREFLYVEDWVRGALTALDARRAGHGLQHRRRVTSSPTSNSRPGSASWPMLRPT